MDQALALDQAPALDPEAVAAAMALALDQAPALDQALALVLALDQVAVLVSLNCAQEFLKSPSLQLAITTLAQSSPLFTISTCKMSKSTTTEEHYMCQLLVSPSIGKWLVRLKIMPRNF